MYVYPYELYDPSYSGYKKLSSVAENSVYEPIELELEGSLIRFENYNNYPYVSGNSFSSEEFPCKEVASFLYRYVSDESGKLSLQFIVRPRPSILLWNYDIMGALKQMNKRNLYAIYGDMAIVRSSIKSIEYYSEIPNNYYSEDFYENLRKASMCFSSGVKTPTLVIYWGKNMRSLVRMTTSLKDAEKIFKMPIKRMSNPNQKNEDELTV